MFPLLIPLILPFIEGGLSVAGESLVGKVLVNIGFNPDVEAGTQLLQKGINTLQASVDTISNGITNQTAMLSVIQSSIGAIGAVSVVGCALSAVNVYQLVKVQKSIRALDAKVSDGFIDL
ncbi:hypothetical protein [Beggiatoa leptomitoformis]|uniref:Uncharacterized protein n=1 Tax=Beggiatoa leptomitoformis TaxID=288004 RepID=A0A2N9YAA3_9GAMM|nr:hypothetical protein [Beggiatoa leptomitoformis]ALG67223.1 hypothetical protein AL038_05240 [Beggiatoa leptomitoformis]AUI67364.1 hypothetical protein BLE401_00745 [Beggiatoa leptomitoformis]